MRMIKYLLCVVAAVMVAAQAPAAGNSKLKVGDPAPDFLGRDIEGNEIRLSHYAGKVVVASFFASWCAPCRKELPLLEKMQRVGAAKGFQVIAINSYEEKRIFRELVKLNANYQLKFVYDARNATAKRYGVKALPHMFVIGKDGKITFVNLGYGESVIDRLIPEVNRALTADTEQTAPPASGVETSS